MLQIRGISFFIDYCVECYVINNPAARYPAKVSTATPMAYGAAVLIIRILDTPLPAEVINTESA